MTVALSAKDIETKAAKTLRDHDLYRYPVDVRELARALNIEVYSADFDNKAISGVIRKENGQTAIYYNRDHHPNRVRFTIAHEIGHFVLGHLENRDGITDEQLDMYRRDDRSTNPSYCLEVAANRFAAALLMPSEFVLTVWDICDGDVEEMARRFRVSAVAMGYRADHVDRN